MSGKKTSIINYSTFLLFIMVGMMLLLVLPKEQTAADENRRLAALPVLKIQTVMDGSAMMDFDKYVSDHFPFRSSWIEISDKIKALRGIESQEIVFYSGDDITAPKEAASVEITAGEVVATSDSLLSTDPTDDDSLQYTATAYEDYQKVNSIIIFNNKAVQVFGGSAAASGKFAKLMTKYSEALGPDVKIYCMPIPVGSDFYLPSRVKGEGNKEKNNIEYLFNVLPSGVSAVRVYDELSKHQNEYLYFRTDHHWTGRGAYYGYVAFCHAAGIEPLAMEQLQRKNCGRFLGSLYKRTRSNLLAEHADSVEMLMIRNNVQVKQLNYDNRSWKSGKIYQLCRGYGSFIGGDYPLTIMESDVKNGKSIMVIKDSYGNPFAPYLSAHFEKVFVVDYRYYEGSVAKLISENQIGALVFAHNIYVINSSYTFGRESTLLGGGKALPRTTKKENTTDSLNSPSNGKQVNDSTKVEKPTEHER